jgi:hypothetical protein
MRTDPVGGDTDAGHATDRRDQMSVDHGQPLWRAVDELLDGATIPGIRANKLGALAARLRRRAGRPVPPPLAEDERGATVAVTMARPLLEHIRSLCDGPLVLLKGPEVARLYPGFARVFVDVDLLAGDAHAAQRALLAAGYVEADEPFVLRQHLRPLQSPTLGLKVELHTVPNWPPGRTPPPFQEILERSVASGIGVDGIVVPDPLHHTLILAAHAWSHEPLQTLRDLVDVAAMARGCSETKLARIADAWDMPRIWRTTRAAIAALFDDGPTTMPLRIWARHLPSVRERTLFANHLMRWLHGFWELPPAAAASQLGGAFRMTLLPGSGESWGEKLARTGHSLRHPGEPMSSHSTWSEELHQRRAGS